MKVMLVDEGAVRLRVREALAETGSVEVRVCAPDGLTAHDEVLARVRGLRPDAVVMNMSMPGGGTLHLIERIKALDSAPVVAVFSSTSSVTYRTLCCRAGAEYFFDLTRGQDELTAAVSRLQRETPC